MKRKRGLERIDTVALRALKTFERNMREGRSPHGSFVLGRCAKTVIAPEAQNFSAVIPVGTNAEAVTSGEVHITAVNKAAADNG
jgi:hypothetical protein